MIVKTFAATSPNSVDEAYAEVDRKQNEWLAEMAENIRVLDVRANTEFTGGHWACTRTIHYQEVKVQTQKPEEAKEA
jgi:hypothetical protein